MNCKAAGALLLAFALACATLLTVSIASASFVHWIQTLSATSMLLIQPLCALVTAILLGLGVYLRRDRRTRAMRES